MEDLRKTYINREKVNITVHEQTIVQLESSMLSIRNGTIGTAEYVRNQITKYETSINNTRKLIEDALVKIEDIIKGMFDTEYKNTSDTIMTKMKDIKQDKLNKLTETNENIRKATHTIREKQKDERKADRKEMDKALCYFYSVVDTLPPFMKSSLYNMPNNKGYLWRGCYFYGRLNDDSTTTTVTELKKGYQIIHEWTPTKYTVYNKTREGGKPIVSIVSEKKL